MANQKKVLVMLAVILVLVIGVSFSIYTSTDREHKTTSVPRLPNAPEFVCTEGMPSSECAQLKLTCGNAVIDPYEDCKNCPYDVGCAAGLICVRVNKTQVYACKYPAGLCYTGPAG